MSVSYISIGSNLGDRMGNLMKAMTLLSSHASITVSSVSSIYETDPVGYRNQDDFLNMVCRIETDLTAHALLSYLQMIEQILHRERTIRFGPRTIDLDILTYDDLVIHSDILTLPHPRMAERSFVLIPLSEILDGKQKKISSDPKVRYFGVMPDNCWLKHR